MVKAGFPFTYQAACTFDWYHEHEFGFAIEKFYNILHDVNIIVASNGNTADIFELYFNRPIKNFFFARSLPGTFNLKKTARL